jgi:fused signal recognition particle receptor
VIALLLASSLTPVLVVLVVVIVVLLGLLGAATSSAARNGQFWRHREPPERGDAGAATGTATLERPAEAPPGPGPQRPETASRPARGAPPLPPPVLEAELEEEIHLPDAIPEAKRPRVRERVGRARELFAAPFASIRRRAKVDEATFEALEEALLLADVGLPTTERLLTPLRARVATKELGDDPDALLEALKQDATALFAGEDRALHQESDTTSVWLFVGVNGVGKTTTIGKLATFEKAAGRDVVLAAGDTFRAAAGEQLELWGERSGAEVVRGAEGADPSSVVFDAIQHAAAKGAQLVLADTAGRLHTKVNLMEELRKVRRVADRPPGKVTEVLLVLDATTGQNGLAQARQFTEAVAVTGVVLTKLDGSAKGGVVLAIRSELGLPIKLIGLGEGAPDLVEFDPEEFVDALFE